ncbi:hypothetical protein [Pseudomonas sp. UBA2684]|uniref:hypothetical protein n=1 Tax=Pseudomonas sp. UBA2684 TaxID=1947311 RepID=UPI000E91DF26|nr:hypothetical protein [Pseudomonas sp. UBA2684]HBX56113.1 hypothetical protein [Pseudomonas sp.]|tara:strand:+ start:41199 stop:41546 length:348 start_codon:yes stop_codon:yes gene_type:complete
MTKFACSVALLGLLSALQAWAAEPQAAPPTIRLIPQAYVSPGASGSIGTSQRYERHDLYGGQRLPDHLGSTREQSQYGSQSLETRGGIRQSIEYPGGYEVQQSPGQGSYRRESTR